MGKNNNGVLRERNCTSENFYYLPRRFKFPLKQSLAASRTCRPAEVLSLILYRAHRLELHSSLRTAELNLSNSLPSSLFPSLPSLLFSYLLSYSPSSLPQLLFRPFSFAYFPLISLQFILDLESLSSHFLSSFFDCYLGKISFASQSTLSLFSKAQLILENSPQSILVPGLVSLK